ncbi:MAG: protein kinase [Acidobacteria bacterium]|nr:protein kinase [Acidobacteriota bacterium]
MTALLLLLYFPQAQAAPTGNTDTYLQLLENTDPDAPAESIPALKDFIRRHPDFNFRGTRQLVALYLYGGKSEEAVQYFTELPESRLLEKTIGWEQLKNFGYPIPETEQKKLQSAIKKASRHWQKITIGRQFMLNFLVEIEGKEPPTVAHLPVDQEAKLYRKIDDAVTNLKLNGLHKLLADYPKDSDFLALLADIFPNANGKIKEQLPEMIFLAKEARKAGNMETALYAEAQIIAVEVNYLGESHLDQKEYERVIEETRRYRFFYTTVDLISTLALHSIFRSNYEDALVFSEKAEKLSRHCHLTELSGVYAGYMGICYSNLSQFDKAVDSYETACSTLKELNPEWYWIWRAKLAYCYSSIGDTDTAEAMYQEILKIELKNKHLLQAQYTYRNLAELYIKRGELDKAEGYLKKVNAKAFPALIKKNNAIFGRLAYARGNYRAAVNYLNTCLSDNAPMDVATQLEAMIDLASAYQALGKNRKAEQAYRDASGYFEELAATRFSNLSYRKGFFRQYHQLYLHYISFLVDVLHRPGKAWLLVRHLETGPFQYFSDTVLGHLKASLSFPTPKLPEFFFNKAGKNAALKKLMVRIADAKTDGKQTILAGPGGVFQTDGTFYTRISSRNDIQQLAVRKGHWAGISRKEVVMDGKAIPLPKMADRVLTAVQFNQNTLLVGSSTGLYRYSQKTWHIIYKAPIIAISPSENGVVVLVPEKGLTRLNSISVSDTNPPETLYPDISEIRDAVSFSRVSKNRFIVFTPDSILIPETAHAAGKIPFPFGVIEKVTPIGTGRWLIFTVLNQRFVLENGQLYQIRMGKSHLLAGCSTETTTFFSTDHTILVENSSPLAQIPLLRESGHEFPTSVERIAENRIALGFRGEGIAVFNIKNGTVFNIKNGTFLGFFPEKLEQFKVNGPALAVLTSSGHVKTYSGILPDTLKHEKTFYPASPVRAMYQLQTGAVLTSFSGGGLVRWATDQPPRFFGSKQGLPAGTTITVIIEDKGHLLLGTDGEILPFDYQKTGPVIPVEGKVTCFTEFGQSPAVGTTSGAFLLKDSAPVALFGNTTTGEVFDLDSTGGILAAATENGVFIRTDAGIFQIPSPEQPRFATVAENELLMVSKRSLFIFKSVQLPVLIQLGAGKYVTQSRNHLVFLEKAPSSTLFLDAGNGMMTPVSIMKTSSVELLTTEFTEIHAYLLPPFGGQMAYIGKPELLEGGKPFTTISLKPGNHLLTVSGVAPFHQGKISFNLKLVRKLSFAWWISGLLGLVIVLLLITRYFKWRKGRYIAHYKILEQLGEGGMGTVFHAKDVRNNRTVALKLLNRNVDPVMIERFKREWQILDKIKHPNIIEVYDRGEHMDRFFIAMEMLHGHTLDEILDKNGPLPEQAVATAALAVTEALEVIHREMIVHRDLKPSNIMYIRHSDKISGKIKPEEIKLMDFGVSKELLREGLTTDGSLVGTLLYVAPESLSSLSLDQRSDIYALGVTMYELITGTPPFTDENQISVYYKILNSPPPPFPETLPISPEMKTIILKCLAKDPEKRYQNARELQEALSALI